MSNLKDIEDKYKKSAGVTGRLTFKKNDFAGKELDKSFGVFLRDGLFANATGNPSEISIMPSTVPLIALTDNDTRLVIHGQTNSLFVPTLMEVMLVVTETNGRLQVEATASINTSTVVPVDVMDWIKLETMQFNLSMGWDDNSGAYKIEESKSGLFPLAGGTKLKMTFSRPGANQWKLALDQSGAAPLTLTDLGNLLNSGADLENSLPQSFKNSALGHLAVVSMSAVLNTKSRKIESCTLVCSLVNKSWTLAPGLTLSDLQTTYTLTHAEGQSPALTAVFDGKLSRQEFSITAEFGSTAPWQATLRQTSVADMFDVFLKGRADASNFFAGTMLTSKLDITTKVYFKEHEEDDGTVRPAGSYNLILGDQASLSIGASLAIEKLGFFFQPKEASPNETEVFFRGAMTLAFTDDAGTVSENTVSLEAKIPQSKQDGLRFSGELNLDPGIPIGQLAHFLATRVLSFGLPGGLEDFTIVHLGISYATPPVQPSGNQPAEKAFELQFSCGGSLPLDGGLRLEPTIDITYEKKGANAQMEVNGVLELVLEEPDEAAHKAGQSINLELSFAKDSGEKSFSASLFIPKDKPVLLNKLIGFFDAKAGESLPALALPVPGFFLAYNKKGATQGNGQAAKGKLLLGGRALAGMKFSDLPMVGSALPANQEIGVTDLMILYAGSDFLKEEVTAVNNLLPDQLKVPFPETVRGGADADTKICFAKGIQISGKARLGPKEIGLFVPLAGKTGAQSGSSNRDVTPAPGTGSDKPGQWFKVGKRLGPLYLSRVGFAFPESRLTLLLEAELALGPLTLTMYGFSVGSPLDRFAPVAGLDGFGLSFVKPPIEISAMFLKIDDNAPTGAPSGVIVKDRFAGVAVIKTSKLSISAIGEYASTNRGPSFYLFAYIGYPLGGPAFFFVEGLALGFGFNRSVRLPEISQLDKHPFVSIAMSENASLIELAEALITGNYVPITPNSIFLALGIRFTTFKILDSFALVVATFGNSFRLDLMGMSKLVLPPGSKESGAPPLAEITLNLSASFAPDEGFFGMRAELTRDSYLLSRDCTLQGGFAFYSWFKGEHEGDFVLTLGGYHPRYRKPAHYPDVPRLGFNWQISSHLAIKGRMYFALTTTAAMAGGRLEAVWHDGNLKAWFIIGADFLISWKPYYYDIELYLQFGVSYTFWFFGRHTLKVELGAHLHIWGPEFSGIASLDIGPISFEVEFGAGAVLNTEALPWPEYRKSFLPERVLGMTIVEGLIKETEDGSWIVDPDRLVFEIESAVPNKRIKIETEKELTGSAAIGAGAMLTKNITTGLQIDLDELEPSHFTITEINKNVPAAVWGQLTSTKPATNPAQRLVPKVLSGARFVVNPPKPPNNIAAIRADFLAFNEDDHPNPNVPRWQTDAAFRANADAVNQNAEVLAAFGLPASGAVLETDFSHLDLTNAAVKAGAY